MNIKASRRGFIKGAAGVAAASLVGCQCFKVARKPNGKIRLAAVGVMGKGFSDWFPMLKSGKAEIVAFCDADARKLDEAAAALKKKNFNFDVKSVPFYTDYRKMFADQDKLQIDACTVSTPDHMHCAIACTAMKLGIHVYVQKPLVRTLWEAKKFYDTAKCTGVVTQMGNQGSGGDGFRRNVEILQSGILGDVTEVHVWTNRPVWPQGKGVENYVKTAKGDPIPAGMNWDAWLGTAKERPFLDLYPAGTDVYDPWKLGKRVYHPFTWRGFFDFGAGAFGDMACHTMNLPFRGLELGKVTKAECVQKESCNSVAYPLLSTVKLTYAARTAKFGLQAGKALPEVTLFWYDGDQQKNGEAVFKDKMTAVTKMEKYAGKVPQTGCLVVGTKGILCSCNDYGQESYIALTGEAVAKDIKEHPACTYAKIPKYIPRRSDPAAGGMDKSSGAAALAADGHYIEFLDAINEVGPVFAETGSRCYSDVDYSIPMMEAILVGTVAQQVPGELKWCSASQKFCNSDAANKLVKPYIRPGWEF